MAGNLGATQVQSAAGVLEKSIRDRAAAKRRGCRQTGASPHALAPLVAELRAALDATADESRRNRDDQRRQTAPSLAKRRAQLTALLSELDPGAADFVETNRRGAASVVRRRDVARSSNRLVQGYAFADAQAQLEHALNTRARRSATADVKDLSDSRILIVDDAKANVDVLVEALRDDYKLSVALDGNTALRSVEKNPPDLVLLDIMMPGLDGYEVCRQLRASESTREVPVMFLSALEDVTNKARGFEVGGNDYLTKPFEMLEVKARVRSLLKAKAYADAVREAMARDLRIAREIQMGILPAESGGRHERDRARRARRHRAGPRGRRRSLRGAASLRQSCRRGAGRRVGKGDSRRALHGGRRDRAAHARPADREPDEILRRLNDELAEQNPRGMFVTLQCLVFDLEQRRVSCAGAGHHQLAVLSPVVRRGWPAPRRASRQGSCPSIRSSARPFRSSPATPSCCSRTACPKR